MPRSTGPRVGVLAAAAAIIVAAVMVAVSAGSAPATGGAGGRDRPAPVSTMPNGRGLAPAGRLTTVGDFPTGGALSPDGRFYWVVDAGHGHNDVQIVDVASGAVRQVLPLPAASGGIGFAPDGRTVYVSGEPRGSTAPAGPTRGDGGDVLHVFVVDPASGQAAERPALSLPARTGLSSADHPPSALGWPQGLAVTPDGRWVVVALNQADKVAVIDRTTGGTRLVAVGSYPYGVAIGRDGRTAYVTNELSGTVSFVDIASATLTGSVGVGGSGGDHNAHPEGVVADRHADRVYVAVTNRDLIAVVDTAARRVLSSVPVGRAQGVGAAPVAVALAPDGATLYSADSGEDAVAVIKAAPLSAAGLGTGAGAGHPQIPAYTLVGKVPTAAYTSDVQVSPDGGRLIWLAAKGVGSGANPDYGEHWADSGAAPYASYVVDRLIGRVGVLSRPTDREVRQWTRAADREVIPANARPAPQRTPLVGPDGGASRQISHVFYVVRENRTYDQVFGTERRGDGDPRLELVDDNGARGPAGGVTPNAHALARQFPLLDRFFADSEVSKDGHIVTAGSYATDYVERSLHPAYANRGRADGTGVYPVSFPPRDFLFDQAARQHVTFRNYGENSAGTTPLGDDGRPTYAASVAGKDVGYPGRFGCDGPPPYSVPANCNTDSGTVGPAGDAGVAGSRFDYYQRQFNQQVATHSVPALTYLTLPDDHTNGLATGKPTPRAMIADNDLALGQLVQLISHSPIWASSAIFVVEDDSQDGADHVDAHRMPAFVLSAWARHGAVVHTHYDQQSVLRSIELILGLRPLSLFDATATPMYDAFTTQPDLTPYTALQPDYPRTQVNTAAAASVDPVAAALPWDVLDAVPQELSDQALWHSVYGPSSAPPQPGPNASPRERDRARTALAVAREHGDVRAALLDGDDG